MSERKTESIVDKIFRERGYENIHYQGSEDSNIQSLLKSKTSKKTLGRGKPEYIIKLNGIASDLLVVECKKERSKHCSDKAKGQSFTKDDIAELDIKNYAVDGVLHYMESLMGTYNVVGLAISGTDENNLEISTFITKGDHIERVDQSSILKSQDYLNLLRAENCQINESLIISNIQTELSKIHNKLRDKMKLTENQKPLLISACLLALQDATFKSGYKQKNTGSSLVNYVYTTIEDTLTNILMVPEEKVKLMMGNFLFIKNEENIKAHLKDILDTVSSLFSNFSFSETSYDIIGNFYSEFLKYTGGDQQGLGIVLTPKHITDVFCDLAQIDTNTVVLDTCTGTGAFLIAAMKNMVTKANGNSKIIERIKQHQLIGIEQSSMMFTLACSNMILRHDGKSNMFNGSCFNQDIHEKVKNLRPTVCEHDHPS